MKTKTFTVAIDEKFYTVFNNLKKDLGKGSLAETFKLAIALLNLANDGKKKGLRLVLADEGDIIKTEIVLA